MRIERSVSLYFKGEKPSAMDRLRGSASLDDSTTPLLGVPLDDNPPIPHQYPHETLQNPVNMPNTTDLQTIGKGDGDANLYPTRTSDQRYADQANIEEQRIGVVEAIKKSPWAIVWCLYAMWCIVLANFQSMAGSSVIGIPQFRKDFGREYNGEFVLDGGWQSAIDGVPRAAFVSHPVVRLGQPR